MHDASSLWLTHQIAQSSAHNSLWFTDENILQYIPSLASHLHKPLLISNRWDVAQQAQAKGFNARFDDFDCSDIAENSQERVFYRISKEKPVVHHIINESLRVLEPGGELVFCGQKNEGIKTFLEKAGALFDSPKPPQKDGSNYFACLKKNSVYDDTKRLDDCDYTQLRTIAKLHSSPETAIEIFSKPGVFGWNKIDQGSALLIEQVKALLPTLKSKPERLLDLGCGYGYLGLMTAELPLKQRVFTDNNAAAIAATRHNCRINGITAEVVAGDAGSSLTGDFDIILCNPPFHQGFSLDGDLTDKFLTSAKRLLAKDGIAVFVVNQFIPLERKAQHLFCKIELLTQAQGFKVVSLS